MRGFLAVLPPFAGLLDAVARQRSDVANRLTHEVEERGRFLVGAFKGIFHSSSYSYSTSEGIIPDSRMAAMTR